MGASDNLMAGLAGAANAGTDIFGKLIDYKLRQRAKQQDYMDEFSAYQQKLPLEEASKIRVLNATPTNILDANGNVTGQVRGKVSRAPVIPLYQTMDAEGNPINAPTPNKPVPLKSPAQTEEDKLGARNKAKLDKELPKAQGSYDRTIKDYESLISQAESVLNDPDLGSATGLLGSHNQITGGARRVSANLDTIKSKTLLNVLSGLKELSSTGASGFGQLSNVEGDTLKNSIANLNRSQATPDFQNNLRLFIKDIKGSKGIIENTFKNTYGDRLQTSSTPTNKMQKERSADDILNQYLK